MVGKPAVPIESPVSSTCRCLPSQPCWPSAKTWEALNRTVGGRLIATKPPSHACHSPHYDPVKCWAIRNGYLDQHWRELQPGAMAYTNWETHKGEGCLGTGGFLSRPCRQGAVPLYTVNASSIEDVQATLKFARQHNIRLVIKNTGHDVVGRSTAPNSLSLWMFFRKGVQMTDAFVPEGAPEGTKGEGAAVIESGVQFGDLYRLAHEHNRTIVGGSTPSVGAAGGFCLGGGNGVLSKKYGLCVDNVLQYKIVTADGELLVANAYKNQDLFWGLRGGGPGTFGVVVESVLRTHPPLRNVVRAQVTIVSMFGSTMDKILRDFLARHRQWNEDGWSGYTFNVHKVVKLLKINYYLPDGDLVQAKASIDSFVRYARSYRGVFVLENMVDSVPTYLDAVNSFLDLPLGPQTVGVSTLIGSRLVPQDMMQTSEGIDKLTKAVVGARTEAGLWDAVGGVVIIFTPGGQITKVGTEETSVSPAWRSAMLLPVVAVVWSDVFSFRDRKVIERSLTNAVDHLRIATPGSGTYINEADPSEPDWQDSFFGTNYPRLLELKRKYDPDHLFVCNRCVGSEDWDEDQMCRRHHPQHIL
ncbi:hypothetical protein DFQ27_006956 [Actinomortierella ambigua]|uniref:FAD-binding PCMH-type domain-containing protein n=1 Tax=Actinomortierella ambigua TaxID=1343610 RepID=A0A9P6UC14_9FUNG|nr:hypothetical protein DFQ27_006956 [Actinomortierella ambigua]